MRTEAPPDWKLAPKHAAENAEREAVERTAAEPGGAARRDPDDDPREEDGWSQPESSAQKGALPDEG